MEPQRWNWWGAGRGQGLEKGVHTRDGGSRVLARAVMRRHWAYLCSGHRRNKVGLREAW